MSPEDIRAQAEIDQFRAQSAEYLDQHIAFYRESMAEHNGSDTCAFTLSVGSTITFVDPEDSLPAAQSNHLTFVAEVLANAVSRLAKAPAE